jgi:hypothetical protein
MGEIGDVVAGPVLHRPVLAEARHATIDEAWIDAMRDIGTEAQPLHDARPETLDEDIRRLRHLEQKLDPFRPLEVQLDDVPAVPVEVVAPRLAEQIRAAAQPFDAQDLCAHLGQHQPGQRHRAEPGHFDHLEPRQRAAWRFLVQLVRLFGRHADRAVDADRLAVQHLVLDDMAGERTIFGRFAEARRERHLLAERILRFLG